jgi:hypothetical protein
MGGTQTWVLVGCLALGTVGAVGCGSRSGTTVNLVPGFGPAVEGSGVSATERREISDFKRLDVGTISRVTVTVGSPASLELVGDDNLLALVEVTEDDGVLRLRTTDSWSSEIGIEAHLTTPDLVGVDVGGFTALKVTGINADKFALAGGGTSSSELGGRIDDLDASMSGASTVTARGLAGGKLRIDLSGTSSAYLTGVVEDVEAELSGASALDLREVGGGDVTLDLSGTSRATLLGRAQKLTLEASGAAHDSAAALVAAEVQVDLSGTSSVLVHATKSI